MLDIDVAKPLSGDTVLDPIGFLDGKILDIDVAGLLSGDTVVDHIDSGHVVFKGISVFLSHEKQQFGCLCLAVLLVSKVSLEVENLHTFIVGAIFCYACCTSDGFFFLHSCGTTVACPWQHISNEWQTKGCYTRFLLLFLLHLLVHYYLIFALAAKTITNGTKQIIAHGESQIIIVYFVTKSEIRATQTDHVVEYFQTILDRMSSLFY